MWAVLTAPEEKGGAWDAERFFATGEAEIADVFEVATASRRVARGPCARLRLGVGRLTRALGTRFESGGRRRHLGGDGRAGARLNDGVPALRVPSQRCDRPRQFEIGSSTSSTRASSSSICLSPDRAVCRSSSASRGRRVSSSSDPARTSPSRTRFSRAAGSTGSCAGWRVGGVDAPADAADADAHDVVTEAARAALSRVAARRCCRQSRSTRAGARRALLRGAERAVDGLVPARASPPM